MSTSNDSKQPASGAAMQSEPSKSPEAPSPGGQRKTFEGWEAFLQHLKAEKDAGRPVDMSKAKVTMRLADGRSFPLGPDARASDRASLAKKLSRQLSEEEREKAIAEWAAELDAL